MGVPALRAVGLLRVRLTLIAPIGATVALCIPDAT